MTEYKPTKTEVLDEMLKPVYDAFNRFPNFKKAMNTALNIPAVGGAFVLMVSTPLFIPTLTRIGYDGDRGTNRRIYSNDQSRFVEESPIKGAIGLGVIGGVIGLLEYGMFAEQINAHPEYLLVPAATNILSGLFEIGRKAYRKTRDKLVRRHQNLESRASE